MCSAHIKIFLSSQCVCLCLTDMFKQKTFKPSQVKCIRVYVSQIFTDVYRCLEMFTRKKKKHLYPSCSVAALSGVALSPLGGKKLDFALQ